MSNRNNDTNISRLCKVAIIVIIAVILTCGAATVFGVDQIIPYPEVTFEQLKAESEQIALKSQIIEGPPPITEEENVSIEETEDESIQTEAESFEEDLRPTEDRSAPLYEVYKNGYPISVDIDLQWHIRDLCQQYGYSEKLIYGMILCESAFQSNCITGNCYGLAQINPYWIHGANVTHFTDDYYNRNLLNPYDNLLTLMEIWEYARNSYDLDVNSYTGMIKLLYWHNTGRNPSGVTSWAYAEKCIRFGEELVPLQ